VSSRLRLAGLNVFLHKAMFFLFYLHALVLCEFRVGDGSWVLRVLKRGGGEGRIPIYKKKTSRGKLKCPPWGIRLERECYEIYFNQSLPLDFCLCQRAAGNPLGIRWLLTASARQKDETFPTSTATSSAGSVSACLFWFTHNT
jgi:hypothetical protein